MPAEPRDDAHAVPIEREIDLHTFRPQDVAAVVDAYLVAAHGAGLHEVRLVHGRGRGVQRASVHGVLTRHRLVEAFWDDTAAHLGATIARLVRA